MGVYESCCIYTNLDVHTRILLYIYECRCIYTNLAVYIRILMYIYTNLDVYINVLSCKFVIVFCPFLTSIPARRKTCLDAITEIEIG